jgi:hypothetical protein
MLQLHLHMNLTASGSETVDWNFTLKVSVLPGRNGCRSSSLCCSETCKNEPSAIGAYVAVEV